MSQIKMNLEDVITAMFESMVKDKADVRATQALAVSIRIQFNHYGVPGNEADASVCRLFKVMYFSPSNYTKVFWREAKFTDFGFEGEYKLLADHDSCWRDNWDELERRQDDLRDAFVREHEDTGATAKSVYSHTFIEKISLVPYVFNTSNGSLDYRTPVLVTKDADVYTIARKASL